MAHLRVDNHVSKQLGGFGERILKYILAYPIPVVTMLGSLAFTKGVRNLKNFVIGTTHFDGSDLTEEDAEDQLCYIAIDKGYTVYEDYCWFSTEEGSNNGYGSYVRVP